jgi:hypothetical protein
MAAKGPKTLRCVPLGGSGGDFIHHSYCLSTAGSSLEADDGLLVSVNA